MIDHTEELNKIEKEIERIRKEISLCAHHDVINLSWEPMLKVRLTRKAIIEMSHEILFI